MSATRIGRWRDDLLPRTHMMAERRVAKDSRHLSQPIKVRIWLLLFPGNHVCESFIESCRFTSHTSCGGEDDRCEDTTFYICLGHADHTPFSSTVRVSCRQTRCSWNDYWVRLGRKPERRKMHPVICSKNPLHECLGGPHLRSLQSVERVFPQLEAA